MVDDPIFIPILQLEQDKKGHPAGFTQVYKDMQAGKTGHLRIEKGRRGRGKVGVNFEETGSFFEWQFLN